MHVEPYLFFDGCCEEALTFYRETLGAEVTMLMRYKESPDPGMIMPGSEDKVMHANIRIGDTTVMASDGRCEGHPAFQGFSLSLTLTAEAEAERLFAALSDGGQVQMPLARTFWSPRFGMVADRFGVSWMINVTVSELTEKVLVITRLFDAPRERLWKAWTEPELSMRWWGPKGFTTPFCKIDPRVGGIFHNCMRSPEGKDYWSTGVYREIAPLERIVCTDSFADEQGNIVPATHYGMSADYPLDMLVAVSFEEHAGKTKLTLTHAGLPSDQELDNCRAGWNESFDKLAEVLARG